MFEDLTFWITSEHGKVALKIAFITPSLLSTSRTFEAI